MFLVTVRAAEPELIADFKPVSLSDRELKQFAPISESILRASSLTLYEGLPHPYWERERAAAELLTKDTTKFRDYPFYKQPLMVAPDHLKQLRKLCAAQDSYWSYGGAKACGGFHPDYCLSWRDGNASYQLLICFTCHEMKLYGPKTELKVDIREEAQTELETTLKRYHDQRPARQ